MRYHRIRHHLKNNQAQVLLIVVMLLATTLTITLSVMFRSRTETQLTKLEEETQKAFAAAEAGIESVLQNQTLQLQGSGAIVFGAGDLAQFSDYSGTAGIAVSEKPSTSSHLLQKDEQYTFYLARYNSKTNTFTNPFSGSLTVLYDSQGLGCNNLALEIAVISKSGTGYAVKRYVADTGGKINATRDNIASAIGGTTIDGNTFRCQTSAITAPGDARLLLVRTLFGQTHIAASTVGGVNLPPQGKTITSQVESKTSQVTNRILLFQSYPQILSDFFTTTF